MNWTPDNWEDGFVAVPDVDSDDDVWLSPVVVFDTPPSNIWFVTKGATVSNYRHSSVTETDFDTQSMVEFFKEHDVDTHVRFEKNYNLKNGPDRILDWLLTRGFRGDRKVFQVYEKNRRVQGFMGDHPIHIEV